MKRWLSFLLCLALAVSALTVPAWAEDPDPHEIPEETPPLSGLVSDGLLDYWIIPHYGAEMLGYAAPRQDTELVIPAQIDGVPVVAINSDAFADQTTLIRVTLPEGLGHVRSGAFRNCTSLTEIILPDSLLVLDDSAFENCTKLARVDLPSGLTVLGTKAFFNCPALHKITLPDSLSCEVGEQALGYLAPDGKAEDLVIHGSRGSFAEYYAEQNGFTFEPTDRAWRDETSGAMLSAVTDTDVLPDGGALYVTVDTTVPDRQLDYSVTYLLDGQPVQPAAPVRLFLPLPEGWDADRCMVLDDDQAVLYPQSLWIDAPFVIEVDHLGGFTVVQLPRYGDVDDNKQIDASDALLILKCSVKKVSFTHAKIECADLDFDGEITASDALTALKVSVGKAVPLPYEESIRAGIQPPKQDDRLAAFSNRLYAMTAAEQADNYVFSPISAYMALAMLHAVADSTVQAEIEALFGMNAVDLARSRELLEQLQATYESNGVPVGQVSLSNSIWIDDRSADETNDAAVQRLARDLDCESFLAPFFTDNQQANDQIRQFIKEKTNGLIDRDFKLSVETLFALINTLYFKDVWSLEGMELPVVQRDFYTANGPESRDFLIGYYASGEVAETETCFYFYAETVHGYQIRFVVPKEGYTPADVMTAENLQQISGTTDYTCPHDDGIARETRCIFPRFTVQSDTDVKAVLQKNGYLPNAFLPFSSDLIDKPVRVSDVRQSTVLEVNEKGAEGAAVTIVDMPTDAGPIAEYHDFVIDRPFGFMLTDPNGVILFTGQITDPHAA